MCTKVEKKLSTRISTEHFSSLVGFLIKHEAKINVNLTVELETWCRPNHQHAQVSKSNKLGKKIMQLDVSTDFDQKELLSRNFPRIMRDVSEPVLILKLSGTSQVENSTVTFNVLWIDPNDKLQESVEMTIEDITITSINVARSNLHHPLMSGSWTVKVLHKKSLIGLTKFMVTPSEDASTKNNVSQNNLDKLIANFYLISNNCISFNHKNIRDIVGSYLGANDIERNGINVHKFIECKKTSWSSLSPDPKSELASELANFEASS